MQLTLCWLMLRRAKGIVDLFTGIYRLLVFIADWYL